jgi:RNA polymerase sigma-70 factor (ECF subfamily)
VEPSDEALCRRVAEGEDEAFELLVTRYQQRVWRMASSILRDAEEARDISQEAFVRLYRSAGSFGGRAKFSTWFYRIVVNLCLDHHRRHRWWRRLVAADADAAGGEPTDLLERQPAPAADPAAAVDQARALRRLWAEVEGLSPQQRATVLLHAQEGLATSEIAAILECSEATVRVHLHRALTALRKRMARD